MSETNSILDLMVKDHCNVERLLDKLEESIDGEHDIIKDIFYKFEWQLEKHLFVEEKAIFTLYNPDDVSEGYKMLPELTQQHNFIINKLKNWREKIRTGEKLDDFMAFKKYLVKHREFEEEKVYPKLDQNLSDEQKMEVVNRINEIV